MGGRVRVSERQQEERINASGAEETKVISLDSVSRVQVTVSVHECSSFLRVKTSRPSCFPTAGKVKSLSPEASR